MNHTQSYCKAIEHFCGQQNKSTICWRSQQARSNTLSSLDYSMLWASICANISEMSNE